MSFVNVEVQVDALPRFEDVQFHRLHPLYPLVTLGVAGVFELPIVVVGLTLVFSVPPLRSSAATGPGFLILGAVLAFLSFVAWFAYKSASVIRYAVRQHDIIVHSGVYWKKETVQPIRRIQHVEQLQGPVDKRFGLFKLKLFSAGTGHFTFEIPGLDAERAASIKQHISNFERPEKHDFGDDGLGEPVADPGPEAPEPETGADSTASNEQGSASPESNDG